MNVELVAYTTPVKKGETIDVVEEAASVCYDSKPTKNHVIAKGCHNSGHLSVFEHISFTFHITGVSRSLLAQLTRHRHFSFSARSQRYCDESHFECVNPFAHGSLARDYFDTLMKTSAYNYKDLVNLGAKKEDARGVLPNACCTELYVTANARALIEAGYLRLCTRAQEEIRTMFGEMREEVRTVCPMVADYMVPQCEKNAKFPFCPERECCGRHKPLKEVYKDGQNV